MTWIAFTVMAVAFVLWGIPSIKYGLSRLWVLWRLILLTIRQKAYFVFRTPASLLSFNRGKHADLLVVCDRKAYLIKFGGSFKRATIIVANSPTVWSFHRFIRSPSHTGWFIIEPTRRDVPIAFDLVSEAVQLRNTSFRRVNLREYTPVYMLTPKPLSISANEGTARQLSNRDEFFGMTLLTPKHFFGICADTSHPKTLNKSEKAALKQAFRAL